MQQAAARPQGRARLNNKYAGRDGPIEAACLRPNGDNDAYRLMPTLGKFSIQLSHLRNAAKIAFVRGLPAVNAGRRIE